MNTEQRMDIEGILTADDVLIVSDGVGDGSTTLEGVGDGLTTSEDVGDGLTTPRLRRTPPTEGNCPALRFPEFSGEWERAVIGKVLTIGSGRDYKHLSSGDIPVYGTGGYMLSVNDYLYDGESVCIGRKGTIDKPVFMTGKFWTVDTLFYTHSFVNVLPKFIYACFQKVNWKLYNEASGVPSLSKTTIEGIGLSLPSLPEQTKIASFLSAVDTKIDQLTQKKALLDTYKKGAMQKIFSQQIRFKADDGEDYPEWEEKKLGEIANKNMQKNKNSKFRYVLTNSASQGIVSQQDYFDKDIANQNNLENYYVVDVDDFVYNPRISAHAPVGPIKRNKLAQGVMSPLYTVFSFKGKVILSFMEMFFSTNVWHDYMLSISNFGARHDRMNITTKDFFDMPILLPSFEEQTKIANFLSAIDSKIDLVSQQLDEAKAFKKGLLQQMFV